MKIFSNIIYNPIVILNTAQYNLKSVASFQKVKTRIDLGNFCIINWHKSYTIDILSYNNQIFQWLDT